MYESLSCFTTNIPLSYQRVENKIVCNHNKHKSWRNGNLLDDETKPNHLAPFYIMSSND